MRLGVRVPFPSFYESKLIKTAGKEYDPEQNKKEDEYWSKYMAGSPSTILEPDSPGVEDSGAPARRHLNSAREGTVSAGANSIVSAPTLSTLSPICARARRQSPASVSNADVSLPTPAPARPTQERPSHEVSASPTGTAIPILSPVSSRCQSFTHDASSSNIGVGISIPFPSPHSSPARTKTSNSEAYGKALASFNALCQSFHECVQLQERENMNAASNEASSSNDVNVNININININGHRNGNTSINVNGTGTDTETDTDFPCDNTRNNEPDQEYDADGESSDPLALDTIIPNERANPSSPEPEADSGYEEGN